MSDSSKPRIIEVNKKVSKVEVSLHRRHDQVHELAPRHVHGHMSLHEVGEETGEDRGGSLEIQGEAFMAPKMGRKVWC